MIWTYVILASALIWFGILLAPWRPWQNREVLEADPSAMSEDLSEVTALIPARNEAEFIGTSLGGLIRQGRNLAVILIDDQSSDNTIQISRRSGLANLRIISGRPLPPGWTGKLWALEQGLSQVHTPVTLLMDADIELRPGILTALRNKMVGEGIQFVSLMVSLPVKGFWERLFMPSFIFFFKLLYPFHLSNARSSKIAAAAGGCVLLETRLLREIGGFKALRGEMIDDCALAKEVKRLGHRTWIGLTHSARSIRPYRDLKTIWIMVARSAFTQLRYSTLLLILCTGIMIAAFCLPVAGIFFPTAIAKAIAAASFAGMMLSYLPTLRFYRVPLIFALTMPLIGTLYLAMTWTSAVRFWRKRGAEWKGRSYGQKGNAG